MRLGCNSSKVSRCSVGAGTERISRALPFSTLARSLQCMAFSITPQALQISSNSTRLVLPLGSSNSFATRNILRPGRQRIKAVARAVAPPSTGATTTKYRQRTKNGHLASVSVTSTPGSAHIEIRLEGQDLQPAGAIPKVHWGMYRASATQWYHPKEAVPQGSSQDARSGGMRSPMTWDGHSWVTQLEVPAKLLPLHLALLFYFQEDGSSAGVYDPPARAPYLSIPLGMAAGDPNTLGATVVSTSQMGQRQEDAMCSVNFAVFSRHASAMYLCLVRVQPEAPGSNSLQGAGVLEIALDPHTNKTGDVWHVCVHGLRNLGYMCYGWRADGDVTWESGGRFHPGFILNDPYATCVVPVRLPEVAYTQAPRVPPAYDVSTPVLLSSLASFTQSFQWGGAHQPLTSDGRPAMRSLEDCVILELDVVKFTTGPEAEKFVRAEHRGKLLGILDRIQDIIGSGATTVLLSPCCLTAPGLGPWGRSPVSLFAPDPSLAVQGPVAASTELKMVVAGLHRAGLEVVMSVEFSLTGEGADAATGGLQGLRGLDAQVYYRVLADRTSVLAAGHPVVRSMIKAALRHWALDYCLDGFAFVHAENLTQDQFGSVLDNPPLAEMICQDPVLRNLKLFPIVGNAQLLPRGGVRGFPHWGVWQQLNDRYRSDMTAYVGSNVPAFLSTVATRITGSADMFSPAWSDGLPGSLAAGRRAAFGVNTVTPVGDVSLLKLMGSEEDLDRAEVKARTLLLALMTSAGTPMISATTLKRKGLWRFVSILAALRQQLTMLLNPPMNFAPPTLETELPPREVIWHTAAPGGEVDWSGAGEGAYPSNVLAFSLRDTSNGTALFVALNPYPQNVSIALPLPGPGTAWRRIADTTLLPPEDIDIQGPILPPGTADYVLNAHGGLLLLASPVFTQR